MRLPRRLPGLPSRQCVLAVAAVVAQFLTAVGAPLPVLRASGSKAADTPFPCQNIPCGCATAEKCWAGACCCFTMREKVAWAAEHGFTPPAHALKLAAEEEAACDDLASCPHCHKKAAPAAKPVPAKWVLGVAQQKCRGESGSGMSAAGAAVAPPAPAVWRPEPGPALSVRVTDSAVTPFTHPPPARPPRG